MSAGRRTGGGRRARPRRFPGLRLARSTWLPAGSTPSPAPGWSFALSKRWRLAIVVFLFAWAFVLLGYGAAVYLRFNEPNGIGLNNATVFFTHTGTSGRKVHITIQTVGALGYGDHPDWVSYLVKTPQSGQWLNDTQWQVPPHTRVVLTDTEYDGATPLRNPVWSQVSGVEGTTEYADGRPVRVLADKASPGAHTSLRASFDIAHTFTIPARGINVPWYAVTTTKHPTLCPKAPCTKKFPHEVDRVTFTSGPPAQYHWQCFIPCGLGYLDGNGGPMQSIGYMGGFLKVVPRPGERLHVGQ